MCCEDQCPVLVGLIDGCSCTGLNIMLAMLGIFCTIFVVVGMKLVYATER